MAASARERSAPLVQQGMRLPTAITVLLLGCSAEPDAAEPAVADSAAPAACAVDTGAGALPPPTWAEFGAPFFATWCQSCHASDAPQRYGAPEGIVFDTRAEVAAQKGLIAASVLERSAMPPGGGLGPREKAELEALLCSL